MTYVVNAGRMQDENLVLHDGTANITADALATVGGTAASGIRDLGAVGVAFDVVIDVSAFDTTTGDEVVICQILGSNVAAMTSSVAVLGEIRLGDATQLAGSTGAVDIDTAVGKHVVTVRNRAGSGTVYRYVRLNFDAAGTTPIMTPASEFYISNVRAC